VVGYDDGRRVVLRTRDTVDQARSGAPLDERSVVLAVGGG